MDAARALLGVLCTTLVGACANDRPPPPRQLDCTSDPQCRAGFNGTESSGEPSAGSEVSTPLTERCLDPAPEDATPARSSIGLFRSDFNPLELDSFDGRARIFGSAETSGKLACGRVVGGREFEIFGAAEFDGPMRIEPEAGSDLFYPTLLNHVDFQELPLLIPVFTKKHIDDIFDDLGMQRDPDKGTIIVEVLEPPGLFTEGRPRHAGSSFTASGAAAVAYRLNGTWRTDEDKTSGAGLTAIVNVPASSDLGKPIVVRQEEEDGTELERQLWVANGAVTYALLFSP